MPNQDPKSDPFANMIQFYENWSKTWAQAMSDTASSKTFAETMGKQMETNMETLALARKQFNEIMEQALQQMSLPTRAEVTSLAERLTRVEMKLDDLDAKMDEMLDLLKKNK